MCMHVAQMHVRTHRLCHYCCKLTVDLVKGWEEEQLKDSHLIAVGGLSSLTSEDKELSLLNSELLRLSHWEVAIGILRLASDEN